MFVFRVRGFLSSALRVGLMTHTHTHTHTPKHRSLLPQGKSLTRGCFCYVPASEVRAVIHSRAREKKPLSFFCAWVSIVLLGSGSAESGPPKARPTLNAQNARRGARPGPKVAPSVHAPPLPAPQQRARGRPAAGRKRPPMC